jgi:serine protease
MRSRFQLALGVCLPFLFAACGGGGGGGGGGPVAASMSGTLSVPNFGTSLGDPQRFDGDAFHARELGAPDDSGRWSVEDRIGPVEEDRLDVFRVALPTGRTALRLGTLDAAAAELHVFDAASGEQVGRSADDAPFVVECAAPTTVDLGVAAIAGATRYRLTIAPTDAEPQRRLPRTERDAALRTPAQALYLGAQHEMVPGEVLVLVEPRTPDTLAPAIDFASIGLVAVEGEAASDVRLLRVATPVPSRIDGAALETSLEAETCLAAKRASSLPGVRAAAPNYLRRAFTVTPNDQFFRLQWHFQILRMEQAWDVTTGSSDVVVAVADTGIVSAHPEFTGRLISGFDFISDPENARDGNGRDPNPEDPGDLSAFPNSSWHGTHVAGTIGARTNDGTGVAGMDWACRLMPLRVLGVNGGSSADIVEAVKFAAGLPNASGTTPSVPRGRADVLNMSLGGGGGSAVEQAIYADARNAGLFVICAAGNDGTTEPQFPASYPTNLSVGAVRFDKARTSYSNQATTVDVMAPGGDLSVDQNGDNFGDGVLSCSAQADRTPVFVFENGTSMACPHVAGLASLLLAARPGSTVTELEQLILQNTEDLGAPGIDPVFRNGLIDPVAALRAATNGAPSGPILAANPIGLSIGTATTTAQISLSNVGDTGVAAAVLGVTAADVDPALAGMLTASLVPATDPATAKISHRAVDLSVDRTGVANGRYTGSVTIRASNAADAVVTVAIEVGTSASADTIFVLLVELATVNGQIEATTVAQTDTDALRNLGWSLPGAFDDPIPDGSYLLVAGTDRDNDNFVGDDGELFGIWPFDDTPELVVVDPARRTLTGLDFALAEIDQISSLRVRGIRRLR